MKKLTVLNLLVMGCITTALADNYVVFGIWGDVKQVVGKNRVEVKVRDRVNSKTILVVPDKGKVILLNLNTHEKVTITQGGTGSVQQMVKWEGTESKKSADKYWEWLLRQISSDGTIAVGEKMGVTERGGADSLLIDSADPTIEK